MTDAQIIAALRCSSSVVDSPNCSDCPYSPDNCRFVTPKENSRNRRNTKFLTVNGEKKCVAEWCETINVSPYTVYHWIKTKGVEYAEKRLSEIA